MIHSFFLLTLHMTARILLIGSALLTLTACVAENDTMGGHMGGMNHGGMQNPGNEEAVFLGRPTDISSLPEAKPSEIIEVTEGQTITLQPMLVKKTIGETSLAMYGYNGQIPGPMIRAKQGTTITVDVTNSIDMPTTIHWHGIRLENSNDGIPDVTQAAIQPNGSFRYTVVFPDEGIYWYHPHVREDIQQDMGLYGNLLVLPESQEAYAPVNDTQVVVLDDLLLNDNGTIVPYGSKTANFAMMGRFGNTLLVNGDTSFKRTVPKGSVIRFYFTNVASARPFRLQIPGAKMKLVGSDVGRYERETFVDSLTLGPAERGIVDVYFEQSGTYALHHASPIRTADLGTIVVSDEPATPSYASAFTALRSNDDVETDIDAFRSSFEKPVDKTLRLTISTNMMNGMGMGHGGMMNEELHDGIEWEDNMMNANMPGDMLKWEMVDEETGKKNMDILWEFTKGDIAKVRIINDKTSAHPMQHPMHFHGQRFLVLSMDGKPTENLVWKDTVHIPAGSSADLLFDFSNPGDWMFHCHIAEHLTNGMMGMLRVRQ